MIPTLHAVDDERTAEGAVSLGDVLDTIDEFGLASRELVAWEFGLPESALAHRWADAVQRGLIRPVGICPEFGELLFALAVR